MITIAESDTFHYLRRLIDYHRTKRMILDAAMVAAKISPYEELPPSIEEEIRNGIEDVISDAFFRKEEEIRDTVIEIGFMSEEEMDAYIKQETKPYKGWRK